MSEWKSQIGGGKYAIQFETNSYDLYREIEKACQKAVDKEIKRRDKGRDDNG